MNKNAPQGWTISNIDKTCLVLDSKRIPINSEERSARKGQYPYYGANGIQGYIDDYIFEGEHFLLAEDGGNFDQWESRPISYLVSGKFWVNNHAHILKGKAGNETKFLHYSLVHKNITKHINGGTRAKLNQSDMRDIELALPPLAEQKKIAAILSSVDDVIESTQAKIHKLKDLKTGMMQELLTTGIDHTEFKDCSVGKIPKSWKTAKIQDVASFITSGSRGWAEFYAKKGAIFIRIGNLTREHINFRLNDIVYVNPPESGEGKRTLVQTGDVLISITADLGIIGVVYDGFGEAYVNQHVSLVRLKDTKLSRWVGHFLAHENSQRQFSANNDAGAKAGLNLSAIRNLEIALPPEIERERIVKALDSVDSTIADLKIKLIKQMDIKKALMQDILTGIVRVKVN